MLPLQLPRIYLLVSMLTAAPSPVQGRSQDFFVGGAQPVREAAPSTAPYLFNLTAARSPSPPAVSSGLPTSLAPSHQHPLTSPQRPAPPAGPPPSVDQQVFLSQLSELPSLAHPPRPSTILLTPTAVMLVQRGVARKPLP